MRSTLRALIAAGLSLLALAGLVVAPSPAGADVGEATHYYLALGDSLAASAQPNGDETHGYVEQLDAVLAASDPKLELIKMGCDGESAQSMRFGSQDPSVVLSCGSPRYYKNFLYSKGTQLADAVSFLQSHKGKVDLVTIDVGANDLTRFDADSNPVVCLFPPEDCTAEAASIEVNLRAILAQLRTAAGPDVPIVGMTYYNVFAPENNAVVDARVDGLNGLIASIYADFGVPVADVAGAFHNGEQPLSAQLVCAWTWYCTVGDVHPNTIGYQVIADAFRDVIQP